VRRRQRRLPGTGRRLAVGPGHHRRHRDGVRPVAERLRVHERGKCPPPGGDPAITMVLSVRRRIGDIARADPDRTALIGFDTNLVEQVLSWREFADRVADAADALRAALTAEVPVFPLNPTTPLAERDALLRLLGRRFTHGYLVDAELRPQRLDLSAGSAVADGHGTVADGHGTVADGHGTAADGPGPGKPGTVAYLLATGASTGIPKISARPGPLRYDPM